MIIVWESNQERVIEDRLGFKVDLVARSVAASLALNIGQTLIMNRKHFTTIEELVEAATGCKPTYPWKS